MDDLTASPASEVPFRISFSGHGGHLRLDPTPHPPNPVPDFVLVRDPRTPSHTARFYPMRSLNPKPTDAVMATAAPGLPSRESEQRQGVPRGKLPQPRALRPHRGQ